MNTSLSKNRRHCSTPGFMLAVLGWLFSVASPAAMRDHAVESSPPVEHAPGDASPPSVAWPTLPPTLRTKLQAAVTATAATHPDWHTRWLNAQGLPWFTNRLMLSPSPYLHEHAHNPINWYPYDDEALAAAQTQHKLLFISIGYASCHWCHVMARESFESPAVARFLNEHFIAVKIDRQQQPGLDDRYQLAVAILNQGRTGWPANVLTLPDGRPVAAELYQPEADLLATLQAAEQAWQAQPATLEQQANRLTQIMRRALGQQAKAAALDAPLMTRTTQALMQQMDPFFGGFGEGAKFPDVARLRFLLDQYAHGDLPSNQATALRTVLVRSLDGMADGGLFDHLGGGFFRYSTTPDWQSPHYEKMAYDQAELSLLYLRAALVLGNAHYVTVARRTLDFVLRDMQVNGNQGFAAALSADSRLAQYPQAAPEEGAFYLWPAEQLSAALPPAELALARRYWQLSPTDGAQLPIPLPPSQQTVLATELHLSPSELTQHITKIRAALWRVRAQRPPPARDNNRILGWNALLIQALATAGRQLNEPRYIEAAINNAQFIQRKLRLPDGQWAHAFNRGVASGSADLSDLANDGLAGVALYDATGQTEWLQQATALAQTIQAKFAAPEGGFYDHPTHHTAQGLFELPLRPFTDGQEPAGNVNALRLWSALAERTALPDASIIRERTVAGFSGLVAQAPTEAVDFLDAVNEWHLGAIDSLQYLAEGAVRLQIMPTSADRAIIEIHFAPGWHSNAHAAQSADSTAPLIPTTVRLLPPAQSKAIDYPPGQRKTLAFSDVPLDLYEGKIRIGVQFTRLKNRPVRAVIGIQPCSTQFCRLPETPMLWLPLGGIPAMPIQPQS